MPENKYFNQKIETIFVTSENKNLNVSSDSLESLKNEIPNGDKPKRDHFKAKLVQDDKTTDKLR
jgi:hypothetical protein